MTVYQLITTDQSFANKTLSLLTDVQGSPVRTRVQSIDVPGTWDNVVRTLADLPTPVGGPPGLINLTAGSWFFKEALNIGNNIIVVPGGVECHLKGIWGKFLTGTATNLIAVNGAAMLETMALSNDAPLLLSGVGGMCVALACDIFGISACVLTTIAFGHFQAIGGFWQAFGGTPAGLYINGPIDHILIDGVEGIGLNDFVLCNTAPGAVQDATIRGCTENSVNGITWPAASVPNSGLILFGNRLNSGTPYNGFTHLSPQVNAKLNTSSINLISETPIVP